jgi:hypothetical protein
LQFSPIVGGLLQVEHQPSAISSLRDADRTQVALIDVDGGAAEPIGNARQVEGHARWCLHRESGGRGVDGLGEFDPDHLTAGLLAARDRLDRVLSPAQQRCGERHHEGGHPEAPLQHIQVLPLLIHRAFSCSCNVPGRSIHSPAAS